MKKITLVFISCLFAINTVSSNNDTFFFENDTIVKKSIYNNLAELARLDVFATPATAFFNTSTLDANFELASSSANSSDWVSGVTGAGNLLGETVAKKTNSGINYIRTVDSDYINSDFEVIFIYDDTYVSSGGDIRTFLGIGNVTNGAEATIGFFLRDHDNQHSLAYDHVASIGPSTPQYTSSMDIAEGLKSVKMVKVGNLITFNVDSNNDGSYTTDRTIDISAGGGYDFLDGTNSHIFFGSGSTNVQLNEISINATAADTAPPTNQDTVYAISSSVPAGDAVSIVSSADATNNVWFAPAETTTFVVGTTMTKAASGSATSILAPATVGTYKLFVIDAAGNVSAASTATLTTTLPCTVEDQALTATDATVFEGSATTITTASSQVGVNYTLYEASGNNVVDGPTAGTDSSLSFATGDLTTATGFYVKGETSPTLSPTGGTALDFDGHNDNVSIQSSINMNGGSAITIEAWINRRSTGQQTILSKWDDDSDERGYMMNFGESSSPNLHFLATTNGEWTDPLNWDTLKNIPLNEWHHVAITFTQSGSDNVKFYYDGEFFSETTWNFSIHSNNAANTIIGGYDNNTNGLNNGANDRMFDGQIDEVRVWNTERSAGDISANMNKPLTGSETGLTAYYNFSEGTSTTLNDLSSGNNDGTLINMDNDDWVTGFGATGADCSVTFDNVSVSVTPAAIVNSLAVPANATYIASQNLDFTVNYSVNITVVTTVGTPQLALTIGSTARQAVYQSGSGTNELLFRYTVQAGDLDTDGIVVGTLAANGGTLKDAAGNNATLTLNSVAATTEVLVDAVAPTNQDTVYASSSAVPAGDAVTIVSLGDATNNVWFAPAGTTTFVASATMTMAASGTATSILAPASGGAYKLFVIDAAGNLSNESTAILTAVVENTLRFDGTNDYVELDDVPFDFEYSDPITIEAWFKRDSNTQQMIYSKSGSGYYELAFVGEKLFFQLQNGGSNNLQAETVNTFTDSNWHHVAFTYDGSNDSNNFNFYVDGVLEQKNLIANNAFGGTGSVLSDNPAYIGARSGTGSYFNGQLDEVRIWSDVRTPAEIQANITTQLVGNEANLLAYYDFNIGISSGDNTGLTTLTDLTSNENNGTLRNFALTGASSNWVASNALSTDITAPTNQNTVYASSSAIPAGDAVTIVSSADVTNNVWFAPAGTTTFVASATMTMAASGTATSILAPVSVGEYKLFVIDAAGNVSAASTATLTAVVENALDFDGVDDYVISNLSGTNVGSYSIEMYIKPNITQSTKGIFTWAPALGSGSAMVIIQQNCTSVDLYVDGNYRIFINVPINSWSHLALTFDGSSYKAYLNGTLSGTYTGGNAGLSFADDIYLGNGYNGYWNGQMDEVRIWDAERTASQITDNMSSSLSGSETGLLAYYNMQNGSGTTLTDLTGSNDGTLTNMDSNDWVAGYSLDSEVDITAPTNQDTVYPISSTIPAGDPVTIVSSGDPTNNVWFAPTGTNSFVEGTTMTKSTTDCTTTSILAPASFGEYKLFVIDAAGNASAASTATLTAFNEPPVITSASTANFVENGTGTAYTITATDTNVITYSLGTGNDEALFNIIGGVLTFINAPDQQTKETYTIEVRANDGTNTASKNVVITIIRQLNTFTTDGNWSDSNWSHGIPTENEDVIIAGNVSVTLDVDDISIYNFTLNTGAILVIPKDKELTIRGDFITNGSLSLGSDSADSGVLFVEGSASGTITYKRGGLLGNKWSLVTAPVSGQKILSFAQSSTNNLRTRTETPVKYAIGWYDSSQNSSDAWQYYTADTPASQEFLQGDSYSMSRSTDGEVSFTGSLNVDNISKTLMANRWSAIGNPYTTYLAANKNSASSFLNDNLASLHDTSQAIYIWDKGEEKYVAVSEVDVSTRSLTPGQGFFIRMKGDQTNISFNKNKRQLKPATGTTVFEKNQTTAPEIVVSVSNSSVTVKTNIKYFDTATTGLDPGYDIGNFNGASLDVFTHLLEDGDAVNYTIQSLPKKGFEDLIIPLGIKTDAGTELTFTADSIDLPADLQVFIEDSVLNVFTALNETSAYTINIDNDMDGIGRFYIHTAKTVLSTTNVFGLNDVMLYVKDATTLSISGLTGGQTKLKLYSLVGKQILKTTFEGSGEREVSIPSLSAGVYLVKLQTKEGELTKKIILE